MPIVVVLKTWPPPCLKDLNLNFNQYHSLFAHHDNVQEAMDSQCLCDAVT